VQREVAAIDPTLPTDGIVTLESLVAGGLAGRRLPVMLMLAFGALALLLASVGVYAMFAAMATARERELGVRVALGSSRGAIAALMLRQAGIWAAVGLALGAVGVVAIARMVQRLLYGVPAFAQARWAWRSCFCSCVPRSRLSCPFGGQRASIRTSVLR
jgi:putative ABC transport system permease protein